MQTLSRLFFAGTLGLLSTADAFAQRGKQTSAKYQDPDLGIAFVLPGEWTRVPQNPNAPWLAARFISEGKLGSSSARAHVRVVVLPQDADRVRSLLTTDAANPYAIRPEGRGWATYREFVKESTPDIMPTGKKFDVQEAGKGASPIGAYIDYDVREAMDYWLLRRARVFEREGMLVAIEASMPAESKDALKGLWKDIVANLRAFSAAKKAIAPRDPWLSPQIRPEDYAAWRALPAAKRKEVRAQFENLWIEAVKQHTGPAWRFTQSKRFAVLTPSDASPEPYVTTLETYAAYLDSVLGPLSDDRVRKWVLRICTDGERRDAFEVWAGPGTGYSEVAMTVFEGSADPLSYGAAQRTLFWTYLHDKNALVGTVLPEWMNEGLTRALYYSSRVRGTAVDFEGDDWARKFVRDLDKKGQLTPLRAIASSDAAAFHRLWSKVDAQNCRMDVQCQAIMCFLLQTEQRIPQLQKFLTRYLQALSESAAKLTETSDRRAGLTEAHAKALDQVIGTDDDVWRRIEAAYLVYVRA